MDPLETSPAAALARPPTFEAGGRRAVWHALAVALAAALAWLIFAAYRQPDLVLDLAALRLC